MNTEPGIASATSGRPLRATGRELREPVDTLVELSDGTRFYTAIRYDEALRGHPALTVGIDLIRSFLEYPMVIGLAEMVTGDTTTATFTFDTGPIWTVTELLRRHRDIGQACGIRAAFELCWLAALILHEAGEIGPREGCYSHGNLTPGRIAVRADGSVQVFGYGLPPIEWICHRDDPSYVIDADSIRYAPPERLAIGAEDPSGDSYALMLIVWEMITGQPMMDGHDVADLEKRIQLNQAQQKVSSAKIQGLTPAMRDVFARALIFDPDTRLSGQQLLDAVSALLDQELPGDSLADLMQRIRGKAQQTPRGRKISTAATSTFTPAELAAMGDDDEDDAAPGDADAPKAETRWGTSRRLGARTGEPTGAAAADPERRARRAVEAPPEEGGRRRRRAEPEPAAPVEAAAPEAEGRRRRRFDEPAAETPAPVAAVPAEAPATETGEPRRRRRFEEPAADAAPATPAAAAPAPATPAPAASAPAEPATPVAATGEEPARRRRRSEVEDAPASAAPPAVAAPAPAEAAPAVEAAAPEAAPEGDAPRRRRRLDPEAGASAAPAADPAPVPAAAPASGDAPEEPTRRRRRNDPG